ncbi:succinylglutamate desuccinylase/aspartoacylase family protein [Natronococcus sp. A-GB1]|uniref:succinylglutamate desuccinylase/aspartoacylase family protein n=1 Tax=Natronococcus sp. A-GB1 TaxID=3037648 RepID=UPI002420442B|nr:succinylglutamate desuccinylase/aspartoacylase family protein [Natronococcus sp. A-GB1]MDG5760353.1 succinylglutamate desuccinylase/aspartoacylase family protein [Natronococcus sp. A-GB1]
MADSNGVPFDYGDGCVEPGEKAHFRYEVGETYLGDSVAVPVTVINGEQKGPRLFLTAAVHGDELNGVKVIQKVATQYDPAELRGTLVCVHVVNVPGYKAQTRYVPIYDLDLNRSFPGLANGNTASRMATQIYDRFIEPCDLGIDFHTSTRNRTTMYHVRADLKDPTVDRLAEAFGANVVLYGEGATGSIRTTATNDGVPTITVEMGRAQQFQPHLIERAVRGVANVLSEFDLLPEREPTHPSWYVTGDSETAKRWLRADVGGLVEMQWGPYPLVHEGDPICTITDHFELEQRTVPAPFTGLLVGFRENPVALPGHPLCHIVEIDRETHDVITREIESGEFDGYRVHDQDFRRDR